MSSVSLRTIQLGSGRRYELLFEIAAGGMGSVWLGRVVGPPPRPLVAIKACHPHLKSDPEFSKMFLIEARLAGQLHHQNIVATIDVGEADTLYLVMEYVEGGPLTNLLEAARPRGGRLATAITLRIVIDMLAGLHAAHEAIGEDGRPLMLVHRDISPHNVIVGVDGLARILDFGVAKAATRSTITREGYVKGKLGYMAPEQLAAADEVSRRSDVYAAGVVLWESLTGRRLFRGATDSETIGRVLRGNAPRPSEICSDVEPVLDAIVLRALQTEPSRRFDSAAELADALEGTGIPIATTREVGAYVAELLSTEIGQRRDKLDEASRQVRVAAGRRTTKRVVAIGAAIVASLALALAAMASLREPDTRHRENASVPPIEAPAPPDRRSPQPVRTQLAADVPETSQPTDLADAAAEPRAVRATPARRRPRARARRGGDKTRREWWPSGP